MAADLLYVPIGGDRFEAQVIAEACRAAGMRVELLTSDASGVHPHLGMAQGHRLLVSAADADRVRAIIADQSKPHR
ncbi:MAG: hypothetical protein MUP76_02460 [Acidimicrobiia bacterium]|nr:hypothetical protein [Acidimicrobiia bacterium]